MSQSPTLVKLWTKKIWVPFYMNKIPGWQRLWGEDTTYLSRDQPTCPWEPRGPHSRSFFSLQIYFFIIIKSYKLLTSIDWMLAEKSESWKSQNVVFQV